MIFFFYYYKNQSFRLRLFRINAKNTALLSVQFRKRLPVQLAGVIGYLGTPDFTPRPHNLRKNPQLRLRFCGKGNSRNCAPRLLVSGSGGGSAPARTRTSAAAAAAPSVTTGTRASLRILFKFLRIRLLTASLSVNLSGRIDVVGLLPCACFRL